MDITAYKKRSDERARFFAEQCKSRISEVSKIFLFGSRARGDFYEGSDYDFAIILQRKDEKIVQTIREIETDFINLFDEFSACLIYDELEWRERMRLPIGVNIEREGLLL